MTAVFLTGATGCIGAATVRVLFDLGAEQVIGFGRTDDRSRLDTRCAARLDLRQGDLRDGERLRSVLAEVRPSHVIHLAAAQTPFCNAHPLEGMRINLGGTLGLLDALQEIGGVARFVFASSAAVYGRRSLYAGPTVRPDDELRPVNHYGRWKLAGEAATRAFAEETSIACVSLRLATTIGPGRDQGLTSAPTTAMKHVARGEPFRLPYQGRECYHWVADVGAAFAHAALDPFTGYAAFNLRGTTTEASDFLDRVRAQARLLGLRPDLGIAADAVPNTFVCDLDDSSFGAAFPRAPKTDLDHAIAESLRAFSAFAHSRDRIEPKPLADP